MLRAINLLLVSMSVLAISNSAVALSKSKDSTACSANPIENVELVQAYSHLPPLPSPLDMIQPSSDSSFWLVASRDGQIFRFENDPMTDQLSVVLDIRHKVINHVEMGLTGMAFHPDYPKDKRLFITYNDSSKKNQSTLASFLVDAQTGILDPTSEEVILTLPQDESFHNGGNVVFGPDNMLYVGFGDGGAKPSHAQSKKNLYGTLIRIDINHQPYKVPDDNPFNEGQSRCKEGVNKTVCPEIYAYGFRNPWRFSFDNRTNRLWLSDVGEAEFEEINIVTPGQNYGWPTMEGSECFDSFFCISWGLIDPYNGYDLPTPQSIAGGYVYRGKHVKQLEGHYIYGDMLSEDFFALDAAAPANTPAARIFNSDFLVASMAQGNDGEIYLLNFSGNSKGDGIYKIAAKEHCR